MALARPASLQTAPDPAESVEGCRIPTDDDIAELLEGLLGRSVGCAWTPGTHPLPDSGRVAVYSDDAERPVAVAVADTPFICRSGGALVMVPTKGVEDAIAADEIPEQLGENFAEVVNIMASLLNSDDTPHVRLTQIHDRHATPSDARASTIVSEPAKRRVFDVNIEDYGRGRIVFLFP